MFIVSVYDLENQAKEVVHYNRTHLQDAINDYVAFAESYNPNRYGVLLYTDNGNIIFGFGEEV